MFDLFGKKRIRELEWANANLNRRLQQWEDGYHQEVNALKGQIIAANRGMGRLLAILDPLYGTGELDPQRIADSDKLSDEIIKKLIAEHIAGKAPNDAA